MGAVHRFSGFICWLTVSLLWPFAAVQATTCIRLTGTVEDQLDHHPLSAQLYAKTADGQIEIGSSSAQTGMFLVSVPCQAVGIFVKLSGYRLQYLLLNRSVLKPNHQPIAVTIPLLPVDKQDINKPYLQTEQTHIEQSQTRRQSGQPQQQQFTIVDALTNRPLTATICFFFTKTSRQRCIDAPNGHSVVMSFPEPDIIAVDVSSAGYQPYQGNLIIDKLDGKVRQHVIRLMRALTLLSVQAETPGYQCLLLPSDGGPPVPLSSLPGHPSTFVTYAARPGSYTLAIQDDTRLVRKQQLITLVTGLNSISTDRIPGSAAPVLPFNPDSSLTIHFDQSSFTLRPEAKATLMQLVTYLTQHPTARVSIIGHTDAEGDKRLNQSLSEHRAKVVSSFLFAQGVTDNRMKLSGHGSRYPIASNDNETQKARNRRVQLQIDPN